MKVDCENTSCRSHEVGDTCFDAGYLVDQINSLVGAGMKEKLNKRDIGLMVEKYKRDRVKVYCREDDWALKLAIDYALHIQTLMPDDRV